MLNLLVNCVYDHIGKGLPQSTAGTAVTHGRVGRAQDLPRKAPPTRRWHTVVLAVRGTFRQGTGDPAATHGREFLCGSGAFASSSIRTCLS
jgi:hypothetical protein